MRKFRIIQRLPDSRFYFLQERICFIWFTVQRTIHSTYDDEDVDREFYSIEEIEEYISDITKPEIKKQMLIIKTISV